MDVQGSRYHLLHGADDWGRCTDVGSGVSLAESWRGEAEGLPSAPRSATSYDAALNGLRLRRDTPLFRRAGRIVPLDPGTRRGVGRDSFGNWYWIGTDATTIRWTPVDGSEAETWWSADDPVDGPAVASVGAGSFRSCSPPGRGSTRLSGLTVTVRHYLLAGYVDALDSGLLVFDLRGGGAPLRLPWPEGSGFRPSDLADLPDGGALVLDSEHARYWRLDAHLRVRGTLTSAPTLFQPVVGEPEVVVGPARPVGTALTSASGCAVSIEPGPAGGVLVLDSDPGRGYSHVDCYDDLTGLRWSISLADSVEVIDPSDPSDLPQRYSVLGHDFVYVDAEEGSAAGPLTPPMLYVADGEGKQVVAYRLEPEGPVAQPDFLPLRRWAGRGLVRAGEGVWYDFRERWIPLEVFTECRFERTATLLTDADFAGSPEGAPFDSRLPGCVWHRLLLDAQIPNGCSVAVRARAHDHPDLLLQTPWVAQPTAYLRSDGPELPWSDPWADRRSGTGSGPGVLPDGTGTYELLFQRVTGRYLQLELTLVGNGRSSPVLRSVRSWYPRFSYPEHYLPAVYVANDVPDHFLERFLANFEGFFLATEERIEHSHLLLDARTAPAVDLPWLAAWFGLALDPLWNEAKRRFLLRHVDRFYRRRGTVAGLVSTLRVYLDAALDESVFHTCDAPSGGVRVVERFLTRDAPGSGGARSSSASDATEVGRRVAQAAHRFDVLVPAGLDGPGLQMLQRIVEVAKPAHTWFDLRQYVDLFVVGAARLGLETQLGHGAAYSPVVLGEGELGSGYLGYPEPFDVTDRVVLDRDRIGRFPAL